MSLRKSETLQPGIDLLVLHQRNALLEGVEAFLASLELPDEPDGVAAWCQGLSVTRGQITTCKTGRYRTRTCGLTGVIRPSFRIGAISSRDF